MSTEVFKPGERESAALVVREAAQCFATFIEKVEREAAPDDWRTKTAAMLAADHVKKLAWVHSILMR